MVKKEGKKRVVKARISQDANKLNVILIENFVNLQRAMTNLTVKFDSLSIQISSLLQLFEISARSFSEKLSTSMPELEKDKEFLSKLNALLDQNKVIAKGLTLMEEKMRERLYGNQPTQRQPSFQPPVQQRFPAPAYPQQQSSEEGYLPSSVNKEREEEI